MLSQHNLSHLINSAAKGVQISGAFHLESSSGTERELSEVCCFFVSRFESQLRITASVLKQILTNTVKLCYIAMHDWETLCIRQTLKIRALVISWSSCVPLHGLPAAKLYLFSERLVPFPLLAPNRFCSFAAIAHKKSHFNFVFLRLMFFKVLIIYDWKISITQEL